MASQGVVQASQWVTTSMLTIPTPSTQTPPAVSLGYGAVNQAAIQQRPSNFGPTMVTPPIQLFPSVSLENLAAGQGPSSIGLATPTTATQSSPAVSQSTISAGQGSSNLSIDSPTTSAQFSPAASLGNITVQAGQGTSDLSTPTPSTQPPPVASPDTNTQSMTEDRRVVNAAGGLQELTTEKEADPSEGVDVQDEGVEESEEVVEDLMPQLLQSTEPDFLFNSGSAPGSDKKKRKNPTDAGKDEGKKRKIETPGSSKSEAGTGSTVEISLVAMNGMVEALQNGTRQMGRIEKVVEKTEKALTEITCMMGKVVDTLTQFKNVVEHNANEDRKREERWFEIERKREEERTREREAERRREDRRREAEKREREELKKLVKEAVAGEKKSKADDEKKSKAVVGEKKSKADDERKSKAGDEKKSKAEDEKENAEREVMRKEEKRDTEDKENKKQPMKSVLERSYTENSMRDYSKKRST